MVGGTSRSCVACPGGSPLLALLLRVGGRGWSGPGRGSGNSSERLAEAATASHCSARVASARRTGAADCSRAVASAAACSAAALAFACTSAAAWALICPWTALSKSRCRLSTVDSDSRHFCLVTSNSDCISDTDASASRYCDAWPASSSPSRLTSCRAVSSSSRADASSATASSAFPFHWSLSTAAVVAAALSVSFSACTRDKLV
mmetsp:Transcript_70880/g.189126  ORF Transcript_70880/g.189126 Transcript_70880/m.189126 type:complete len:205 (-) Transcript_70880:280-894(-)